MIYEHLAASADAQDLRDYKEPAICATSKHIRQESLRIFFAETRFIVYTEAACRDSRGRERKPIPSSLGPLGLKRASGIMISDINRLREHGAVASFRNVAFQVGMAEHIQDWRKGRAKKVVLRELTLQYSAGHSGGLVTRIHAAFLKLDAWMASFDYDYDSACEHAKVIAEGIANRDESLGFT
jgi:hypothetical protein